LALRRYYKKGVIEAGCDEAGRGCLAGPVFAAAVVLPSDFDIPFLNDSKKLTPKMRYMLREQIQRNTYFMDVEKMAASQYAILVEEVIEARKKEVESLSASADLTDILATYYGFKVLTTGVLLEPPDKLWRSTYTFYIRTPKNPDGITETAADAFDELCDMLDRDIDLNKHYQTLGSNRKIKKKCSEEMAQLLRHIITMAFYRAHDDRRRSMLALAESGDSRAVPFLHLKTKTVVRRNENCLVMALRDIGHPSSFDILKDYLSHENWRLREIALEAMGMYSCEEASIIILNRLDSNKVSYQRGALSALGYRKREVSIENIKPYLSNPKYMAQALRALTNIGPEGKQAVLDEKETIWDRAIKSTRMNAVLLGLKSDEVLRPLFSDYPLDRIVPFLKVRPSYRYKEFKNAIEILVDLGPRGEEAIRENIDSIWKSIAEYRNPPKLVDFVSKNIDRNVLFLQSPAATCKGLTSIAKNYEEERIRRYLCVDKRKNERIRTYAYQKLRQLFRWLPEVLKEDEIAGLAECLDQSDLESNEARQVLTELRRANKDLFFRSYSQTSLEDF